MKNLNYELKNLCKRNRDGGHATQAKRHQTLQLAATQLLTRTKYRRMEVTSLREDHVKALVALWKEDNLSINTIKARMSCLRWWAEKIGKPNIISKNNSDYGIENRRHIPTESKACDVSQGQIARIENPYVQASLMLAREFGLRKEEAIKFTPSYADQGDHIRLKSSWCKGGKARTVPILTPAQREALEFAKSVAGRGSLIPPELSFQQQCGFYEKETVKVGLKALHGLRHQYAQSRYEELTGWKSPLAGGPKQKDLTPDQRDKDKEVRLLISKELGHERLQITATYIGSN